jgi:urease accessory protein
LSSGNLHPPAVGLLSDEERSEAGTVCGAAEIGFDNSGGRTRLAHLYQRSPLRVLFPEPEDGEATTAVLVTTSGGLVAGDRLGVAVEMEQGAAAHLTTAAAEKIYRSAGATTIINQRLRLAAGACLEFLPQETIVFDAARVRRATIIELSRGAGFLGGGIVVFGRHAYGETFAQGLLRDAWEVYRDGALVWGDALHLDGDIAAIIADPACLAGAAACATLILAPPRGGPRDFIDGARAAQQRSASAGLRGGVTVVAGLLIARWLGPDALALRRAFADCAGHLRAAAFGLPRRLPRLWQT